MVEFKFPILGSCCWKLFWKYWEKTERYLFRKRCQKIVQGCSFLSPRPHLKIQILSWEWIMKLITNKKKHKERYNVSAETISSQILCELLSMHWTAGRNLRRSRLPESLLANQKWGWLLYICGILLWCKMLNNHPRSSKESLVPSHP